MKKFIAFVIAAMMIVSMIPVMALTASAANEWNIPDPDKGSFWTTYRDITEYNLAEGEPFKPTAGYKYTSEGFQTIAPDYTGTTPKYTVATSEAQDIADGFYMQLRVDAFSYDGGTKEDEWISFFISDTPTLSQGNTKFGNYWCCLIRGTGDGNANVQSFVTVADVDGKTGAFNWFGDVACKAPKDADGRETYEFAVIPKDDGSYSIEINGVAVSKTDKAEESADKITPAISAYEECYIGFTFHSGVKDGTAQATILKQGNGKEDAAPITSGPAKEPEVSKVEYAPIADPSTIAENMPALILDGELSSSYGEPIGSNCGLSKNADGTWKINATGSTPYFLWSIKYELSYEAQDFPVFAMMLKNYGADDGGIYYCAGDVLSSTNECMATWSQWDLYEVEDTETGEMIPPTAREYAHEDDAYVLVTIDLSESVKWAGRIHSIRPNFAIKDLSDTSQTEFDIGYLAMFRSLEEAFAYGDAYIQKLGGVTVEQTTAAPKPTETETESESVSVAATEAESVAEEGCASAVGFASAAILSAAAAAVALKRKH